MAIALRIKEACFYRLRYKLPPMKTSISAQQGFVDEGGIQEGCGFSSRIKVPHVGSDSQCGNPRPHGPSCYPSKEDFTWPCVHQSQEWRCWLAVRISLRE